MAAGCLGALLCFAGAIVATMVVLNATQHGVEGEQRGLLALPLIVMALPIGYVAGVATARRRARRRQQSQRTTVLGDALPGRLEVTVRADGEPRSDVALVASIPTRGGGSIALPLGSTDSTGSLSVTHAALIAMASAAAGAGAPDGAEHIDELWVSVVNGIDHGPLQVEVDAVGGSMRVYAT